MCVISFPPHDRRIWGGKKAMTPLAVVTPMQVREAEAVIRHATIGR